MIAVRALLVWTGIAAACAPFVGSWLRHRSHG